MAIDEFQSPQNPKRIPKGSVSVENGETREILISPGFRSVAAMAGWDEEALLCATLIVEDTPERESVHKKRVNLQLRTPPTNSRRKRRNQRVTPASNPIVVLNLDDEDDDDKEKESKKTEPIIEAPKEMKIEEQAIEKGKTSPAQQNSSLPCMDKLREELSCAICLEICFEPSTTPCGHSFCKKCLKSAADKCGKRCPKCRQLIGNGRSCTVNTILWNTIQLLFPQEVESRKAASVAARSLTKNSREASSGSSTMENHNVRTRQSSWNQASFSIDRTDRMVGSSRSRRATPSQAQDAALVSSNWSRRATPSLAEDAAWASSSWSRRATPNQAEDAALAFRLQREEFMEAFRGTEESAPAPRISSARANIRAMASRAINHRTRGGPM